jgi:hypothetical protein
MVTNKKDTYISKTERFFDIVGTQTYAVSTLAINPGDSSSFPWSYAIAGRYDRYNFNSISFTYKPNVATNLNGQVALFFDWDVSDTTPPIDMRTLTQNMNYVTTNVWKPTTLVLNPKDIRMNAMRYVRNLTPTPSQGLTDDPKTYELGRLWVATEGIADTSNVPFTGVVGWLEVNYHTHLVEPTSAIAAACPPCPPISCVPFVPGVGGGGTVACPAGNCVPQVVGVGGGGTANCPCDACIVQSGPGTGGTLNCPCQPCAPPANAALVAYSTRGATGAFTTTTIANLIAATSSNNAGSTLVVTAGSSANRAGILFSNTGPPNLDWATGDHFLIIIETLGSAVSSPALIASAGLTSVTVKQTVTSSAVNANIHMIDCVLSAAGFGAQLFSVEYDWISSTSVTVLNIDAIYAKTVTPI